jgi:hypothetical protein
MLQIIPKNDCLVVMMYFVGFLGWDLLGFVSGFLSWDTYVYFLVYLEAHCASFDIYNFTYKKK